MAGSLATNSSQGFGDFLEALRPWERLVAISIMTAFDVKSRQAIISECKITSVQLSEALDNLDQSGLIEYDAQNAWVALSTQGSRELLAFILTHFDRILLNTKIESEPGVQDKDGWFNSTTPLEKWIDKSTGTPIVKLDAGITVKTLFLAWANNSNLDPALIAKFYDRQTWARAFKELSSKYFLDVDASIAPARYKINIGLLALGQQLGNISQYVSVLEDIEGTLLSRLLPSQRVRIHNVKLHSPIESPCYVRYWRFLLDQFIPFFPASIRKKITINSMDESALMNTIRPLLSPSIKVPPRVTRLGDMEITWTLDLNQNSHPVILEIKRGGVSIQCVFYAGVKSGTPSVSIYVAQDERKTTKGKIKNPISLLDFTRVLDTLNDFLSLAHANLSGSSDKPISDYFKLNLMVFSVRNFDLCIDADLNAKNPKSEEIRRRFAQDTVIAGELREFAIHIYTYAEGKLRFEYQYSQDMQKHVSNPLNLGSFSSFLGTFNDPQAKSGSSTVDFLHATLLQGARVIQDATELESRYLNLGYEVKAIKGSVDESNAVTRQTAIEVADIKREVQEESESIKKDFKSELISKTDALKQTQSTHFNETQKDFGSLQEKLSDVEYEIKGNADDIYELREATSGNNQVVIELLDRQGDEHKYALTSISEAIQISSENNERGLVRMGQEIGMGIEQSGAQIANANVKIMKIVGTAIEKSGEQTADAIRLVGDVIDKMNDRVDLVERKEINRDIRGFIQNVKEFIKIDHHLGKNDTKFILDEAKRLITKVNENNFDQMQKDFDKLEIAIVGGRFRKKLDGNLYP